MFMMHKSVSTKALLGRTLKSAFGSKLHAHTTVDRAEVQRHAQHADHWWHPDGAMKALHSMNLIRVPFIRDGLLQYSQERSSLPLKGKNILDVGCGGGILSEPLARLGARVTGIDASSELIAVAREHSDANVKLADNKPTYICTTIEEHIKNCSNHYDGVVSSEVIEHVNNKETFVKCCIEAAKPGGRTFFTTPNRTRLAQLTIIGVTEYLFNMVPRGTHHYDKFITPNELTFLLERNNCHVEAVYGVVYNILSNKWNFMKSQSLAFALQAAKLA